MGSWHDQVPKDGGQADDETDDGHREEYVGRDGKLFRAGIDATPYIPKPPGGDGHVAVKVKGKPDGEAVTRVEQPRGELMYYLKGTGAKYMDRVRIRTPTFANIPPLLAMLPGCELADVPVIVLSIDPCISCTER